MTDIRSAAVQARPTGIGERCLRALRDADLTDSVLGSGVPVTHLIRFAEALLAAAPAPQPTGDELRAMLVKARAGLANGLWDYGPGQDEHEQCDALIAEIDAMLAASPSPQHDGPSDAEMLEWMEAMRDLHIDYYLRDGKAVYIIRDCVWGHSLGHGNTVREAIRAAMRGDTGGKTE